MGDIIMQLMLRDNIALVSRDLLAQLQLQLYCIIKSCDKVERSGLWSTYFTGTRKSLDQQWQRTDGKDMPTDEHEMRSRKHGVAHLQTHVS